MTSAVREDPQPYATAAHRFTAEEYWRLVESGALGPEPKIELIEGVIVDMVPMGGPHAAVTSRLNRILTRALPGEFLLRVQMPLNLGEKSVPEPDLCVVRAREDDYASGHPEAADALLVIEVARTSLRFDREAKVPLYARAGIPEVWLFDVKERAVTVYREPRGGAYAQEETLSGEDRLASSALPGVDLALAGILP